MKPTSELVVTAVEWLKDSGTYQAMAMGAVEGTAASVTMTVAMLTAWLRHLG